MFMQYPYYEMTVPVFIKMLTSLDSLLDKGLAHATETGMTETTLLDTRLAPDMFPLVRQIQIATDGAKGCVARITGGTAPLMEDTETTIAALKTRVAATVNYLQSVPMEVFADAGEQRVEIKYFPGKYFTGHDYVTEYALPNFFFHVTTAYGILRQCGVTIGKTDYLGTLSLQDLEA